MADVIVVSTPGPPGNVSNASLLGVKTTPYVAQSGDDVPFNTTSATITQTLPAAAIGARWRATNVGTANAVVVQAAGSDTIIDTSPTSLSSGRASVGIGTSVQFTCYVQGKWSRH